MSRFFEPKITTIKKIVELPLEECEMYDVGMYDSPHTFFANNILVHNSAYISALPLLTSENDVEGQVKTISNDVTEKLNKSLGWLTTNYFNSKNNRLKFMQEKVIETGFWGSKKKRYAVKDVDGHITVKGFDMVRSSFPKIFRRFQQEIINDILDGVDKATLNAKIVDFKKEYSKCSIYDILLPSSVKEISKFDYNELGTPIHVKSAQNYNMLLKIFNIDTVPPIDDGDKILYGYVTQNSFGFKTMAIKGQDEDPPELIEFIKKYIDREKIFNNTLISKIDTIWADLGWGKPELTESHDFF